MAIFDRFRPKNTTDREAMRLIQTQGDSIGTYNGRLYDNDIVRACIAPYVNAASKLSPVHVRRTSDNLLRFPEPYIRAVLTDPNPYTTMPVFLQGMALSLALNGNAFALIARDGAGYPVGLYQIPAVSVEAVFVPELRLKFTLKNGKELEANYTDIVHLKENVEADSIFGNSPRVALSPLMDVVHTTDKGIIKAIKNSGIVQWLLKFSSALRPEDVKLRTEEFVNNYLTVTSSTFGAAGIDSKVDAQRIEPKDYVPASKTTELIYKRIQDIFGVNSSIISGRFTEEEWNAYYESKIEPLIVMLSAELTRKLFSKRERAHGNEIVVESSNLLAATLKTKLQLVGMVDRGALTPNEWRAVFGLSPVEGGDVPLRRLDTTTVSEVKE